MFWEAKLSWCLSVWSLACHMSKITSGLSLSQHSKTIKPLDALHFGAFVKLQLCGVVLLKEKEIATFTFLLLLKQGQAGGGDTGEA